MVETRTLAFVSAATGGAIAQGQASAQIRRVGTDSRSVQPGDLFIALAGERFDGHNFLTEVAANGATAVVIESGRRLAQLPACAVIEVANTRTALVKLAGAYRAEFDLPIVAVAGSNGKTTTKELIASVLRQKLPTL